MVEELDYPSLYGTEKAKEGDSVVTHNPTRSRKSVLEQCSFAVTVTHNPGVVVPDRTEHTDRMQIAGEVSGYGTMSGKVVYDTGGVAPSLLGA